MILNSDPRVELKKITTLDGQRSDLNTRWDDDLAYYRQDADKYAIPTEEGEWDKFIPNRATTEGNKIIDYLSYAKRKVWIPVVEEAEKKRRSLSATERLAIGLRFLADTLTDELPDSIPVQKLLSAYRVMRGWTSELVYLYEDEDGEIRPMISIWDIRNTYWIQGSKRLVWVGYRWYSDEEMIKEEYPGWNGSVDSTGYAEGTNVWGVEPGQQAQEAVIVNNEYVKEPTDCGLDYIPIRIKPGRSLPLIHDKNTGINLPLVGESYLANYRNLLATEARLIIYKLEQAGKIAQTPLVGAYDTTKGGVKPEMFSKSPFKKGRSLWLDEGKGEKILQSLAPLMGREIDESYGLVATLASKGGLSDIAYGVSQGTITAQGTAILSHAALETITPFKQGVEEDERWIHQELIRQYKAQKYGELKVEGYDRTAKKFSANIKPDDIDTKWRFECELIPDIIRDEQINMGMAVEAVKSGLLSKQTAREKYHLVDDTDFENDIQWRERGEEDAEIGSWIAAAKMAQDGNYIGAQIMVNRLRAKAMQGQQQPQGQMIGAGAQPGQMSPKLAASNVQPRLSVPPDIRQAARMNMEQGV